MDFLAQLSRAGSVPTHLTLDGLEAINRGHIADESNLGSLLQRNEHEARMYPMREQQQQLSNDVTLAQLPGMRAQSGMMQRKNSNEAIFNDQFIQDTLGKYKEDEIKRHLSSMDALGVSAQQAAELVTKNPVGGVGIARDLFKKAGHGNLWNPAWDTLSPGKLAVTLDEAGKAIQSAGTKFNQALSTQALKSEAAAALEAQKARDREALQSQRLAAMAAMQKATQDAKKANDKQSLEQLAARALMAAQQAKANGDNEAAAQYYERFVEARTAAEQVRAASATVTTNEKPDLGELGVPTVGDRKAKPGTKENPIKLD